MVQPQNLGANLPHLLHGVADQNRRCSTRYDLLHPRFALFFRKAPHAQHLVQDEEIRLHQAGDREGQP